MMREETEFYREEYSLEGVVFFDDEAGNPFCMKKPAANISSNVHTQKRSTKQTRWRSFCAGVPLIRDDRKGKNRRTKGLVCFHTISAIDFLRRFM